MLKQLLKSCKHCGFSIDAFRKYTAKELLKIFKAHLITAKLFGCILCVNAIQKKINKIKGV